MTRPSRSVTVATVTASAILAAGGFLLGDRSDAGSVPAAVPVQSVQPAKSPDPIIVPSDVDLPPR
ncbi:MAG: hypothetical protein QOE11_914 [Solirubrobacteraceae bacterium]|nr:hypothetical protein [Solirubrobacteraceae bacterium]